MQFIKARDGFSAGLELKALRMIQEPRNRFNIDVIELKPMVINLGVLEKLTITPNQICGRMNCERTRFGTGSFSGWEIKEKSRFSQEKQKFGIGFFTKPKIGQRNQEKQQIHPKEKCFGIGFSL